MHHIGIGTSLDRIAIWIVRIAYLNFLWFVFTIIGLIGVGVFPATIAALGITRKWLQGKQKIKMWQTFKDIYKQEFVLSNALGWILVFIGGVLYVNYRIITMSQEKFSFAILSAFCLVVFLYFLVVIWSFPLAVHYHAGIFKQLKNALVIGLSKIHISILMMVSLFSIVYLSLEFPTLILFCLFSLTCLIWIWFSLRVFQQIDNKSSIEAKG